MTLSRWLLVISLIVVCFTLPAFFRWRKQQKERKQKILSTLLTRGNRLFLSIESIPDRYFPKETKIFVVEYLLSIINQVSKSGESADFLSKQSSLAALLSELKVSKQPPSKVRIINQEQLEQMQVGLGYIQQICRKLSDGKLISKDAAYYHVTLLRYASALGNSDLLVKQARQDLDNDKQNQALDKYRQALSIIEKSGSVIGSEKEAGRLQFMIDTVEKELFTKNRKKEA